MKAEGECPGCGNVLGVEVGGGIASMMGDTIERLIDKDGNRMRCPDCEEYVEPDGVDIHE